jgi:hypothetical protein
MNQLQSMNSNLCASRIVTDDSISPIDTTINTNNNNNNHNTIGVIPPILNDDNQIDCVSSKLPPVDLTATTNANGTNANGTNATTSSTQMVSKS